MVSLITGVVFIAFCVFALCPQFPLNWGAQTVEFLKGFAPVLAAFVGIICVFIGVADIKDKRSAAREEKKAREQEKENSMAT